MLIETSLQSLTTEGLGPEQCHLSLRAGPGLGEGNLPGDLPGNLHGRKELRFQIDSAIPLSGPLVESLAALLFPILETFKLFTQGTYEQNFQPQSLTWRLCWPSLPLSAPCPASLN
ncbi:MAG: hypothetical protein HC922_09135 [Leptolyngbyaceae cyanobacterium SM2_3_12]|nr:hypothetical protein [Leptolyngbyaceae cyanobacterium SM2_3_12]